MKATVTYIEQKFEEFNHRMFGGRLPKLPVVLTDEAGALGKVRYFTRKLPDGSVEYDDFELRINTRIDLPEAVVEDTIIHEMIHYFILLHNMVDTAPHGDIFKAVMQSINASHGRKLTISYKGSAEEQEQSVSTKPTWHVIAAVYFKSGITGVKVLPRTVSTVLKFHSTVNGMSDVDHADLYLHNNPFFNRYPTSGAIRVAEIDSDALTSNLSGARRLRINGNQIVEVR